MSYLNFARANCGVEDLFNFTFQSILSPTFQTEGDRLLYNPTVAAVLDRNIMGIFANETPKAPIYLYHATQDEIIPYANASTLYTEWCQDGASVQFVTYGNGGHATTEIVGFSGAFEFVQNAFAGSVTKACSQQTKLNNTFDPLALGVELEPILVKLITALDIAGQGDSNIIADLQTLKTSV